MRLSRGACGIVTSALVLACAGSAHAAPAVTAYSLPGFNNQPSDVAAGPDGALWLTEGGSNQIGRITTAGSVHQYPIPTAFSGPRGIAAGPGGTLWFTESAAGKIGSVTTAGVVSEHTLPTPGAGPNDIAAGPDGALWFTERSAGKIGRITTAGAVTEYPLPSSTANPTGIAAGPDGNLWFTESAAGKVARITPTGTITEFTLPSVNPQPLEIVAGDDGALWFTEGVGRVGRITTAGSISELPVAGGQPSSIAVGPDGAVWFTQAGGGIAEVAGGATIATYALQQAFAWPQGIAEGPDNRLWVAESGANAVAAAALPPVIAGESVTGVGTGGATLTAGVNPNGQSTTVHFEYGTTPSYGAASGPLAPSGQAVSAAVGGLAPATTYHYRAVASSAGGTTVGADETFTTAAQAPTPLPTKNPTPSVATMRLPATLAVSPRGVVSIDVSCPATAVGGCRDTLTIMLFHGRGRAHARTVVSARCGRGCRSLGSGRVKVRPGHGGHVGVLLSGWARHLLARRAALPVRITLTARSGAATTTTSGRTTLRATGRRR